MSAAASSHEVLSVAGAAAADEARRRLQDRVCSRSCRFCCLGPFVSEIVGAEASRATGPSSGRTMTVDEEAKQGFLFPK